MSSSRATLSRVRRQVDRLAAENELRCRRVADRHPKRRRPSRPTLSPAAAARDQRLAARIGHLDPGRRRRAQLEHARGSACDPGGAVLAGATRGTGSAGLGASAAPPPLRRRRRTASAPPSGRAAPLAGARRRRPAPGGSHGSTWSAAGAGAGGAVRRSRPAWPAGRTPRARRPATGRPQSAGLAGIRPLLCASVARPVAERRVDALAHLLEPVAARRRQRGEHRRGIDLQRPADGLRQRAGEGGVGQLVEAIGLQHSSLRGATLIAAASAAMCRPCVSRACAQQPPGRRAAPAPRAGRRSLIEVAPLEGRRFRATSGSGCAAARRIRSRRAGCPACSMRTASHRVCAFRPSAGR